MFFTFWGLSVVKRHKAPRVAKDLMGRMFGAMLPKDAGKLSLSKMNFGGLGAKMMKSRMKAKKIEQLESMMRSALAAGGAHDGLPDVHGHHGRGPRGAHGRGGDRRGGQLPRRGERGRT